VRDDVTPVTVVDNPAPQPARDPVGLFTVERYFALVDDGVLAPDDRERAVRGWAAQDRVTKAMIHVAAAVPEYWIVDIRARRIEVHRDPEPTARRYRSTTALERGRLLRLVAFPDTTVVVDDLLPILAR
jgi:hypothetical protein